jgi:hypothetical protein
MAEGLTISPAPDTFEAAVIAAVVARLEVEAAEAALPPSPPRLSPWVAAGRSGGLPPPTDPAPNSPHAPSRVAPVG